MFRSPPNTSGSPAAQATVGRGPLRVTVDEDGKTRIKERYVVSAPVFGRVLRVELKAGDRVEAGKTVLATIEPVDPTLLDARERATVQARLRAAEAAVTGAQARLERGRAAHALEKLRLARVRQLGPGGGIAPDEVDKAEHAEWIAREELRAAQSAVKVAFSPVARSLWPNAMHWIAGTGCSQTC